VAWTVECRLTQRRDATHRLHVKKVSAPNWLQHMYMVFDRFGLSEFGETALYLVTSDELSTSPKKDTVSCIPVTSFFQDVRCTVYLLFRRPVVDLQGGSRSFAQAAGGEYTACAAGRPSSCGGAPQGLRMQGVSTTSHTSCVSNDGAGGSKGNRASPARATACERRNE
jgi:hypothetical protein